MASQCFTRRVLIVTAGLLVVWAVGDIQATVIHSNGTGGGDWSAGATWVGGNPPSTGNPPYVEAGDTVTATDVVLAAGGVDYVVLGTLNLNNTQITNVRRLEYQAPPGGGVINLTNGSRFDYSQTAYYAVTINVSGNSYFTGYSLASGSTVTVASGGTAEFTSAAVGVINGSTNNINTGGTLRTTWTSSTVGTPTINLNGGTMIFTGGLPAHRGYAQSWNWTTGTYVNNDAYWDRTAELSALAARLSSNPANVLQLSNSGKKVFLLTLLNSLSFAPTAGNVAFNIYSATDNDNDSMSYDAGYTGQNYTFSASVKFLLVGNSLPGVPADYVGRSYRLVNDQTPGGINATVPDALWTIGGKAYPVHFDTALLASQGIVSVASIKLPPQGTIVAVR